MINENNKLIEQFYTNINLGQLKRRLIDNSYYSALSSLDTLKNINLLVASFNSRPLIKKGDIILELYGLLQGLFVAIDSLYALSWGITNSKWSVNVNLNPVLRQIKYVRNDCVGHPTKRNYKNGVGYCDLDIENTDINNLIYTIHKINQNDDEKLVYSIKIDETIKNYYMESNRILKDIYNRVLINGSTKGLCFSKFTTALYQRVIENKRAFMELSDLKREYTNAFHIENESDRFIWRINIISDLMRIGKDELINFVLLKQIEKINNMAIELDKKNNDVDFSSNIIKIKVPNQIMDFIKILHSKNIDIDHIKDNNHDDFKKFLVALSSYEEKSIKKIYLILRENKNNSSFIYAFIYALKDLYV